LQTPPPLSDFEQWIDTEIKEEDKRLLQSLKEWDAERAEILEKRRKDESLQKEHKEEEERRHVAAYREEREKKLERIRRAKAAIEENPDAQRKKKWSERGTIHRPMQGWKGRRSILLLELTGLGAPLDRVV
jgi:hypothetical protein